MILVYSGQGTLRVNLLLYMFGVFDFLEFEKAPTSNVERRGGRHSMKGDEKPSTKLVLPPWTYCPVTDPEMVLRLVDELLHLIIILITVLPLCEVLCIASFKVNTSCVLFMKDTTYHINRYPF